VSDQETAIGQAVADIGSRKADLVEELREKVEEAVRERLEAAMGNVLQVLGQLGGKASHAAESVETGQQSLGEGLADFGERLPVLEGGVVSVKEAAREVGLNFA
jgi:hypothetical protein